MACHRARTAIRTTPHLPADCLSPQTFHTHYPTPCSLFSVCTKKNYFRIPFLLTRYANSRLSSCPAAGKHSKQAPGERKREGGREGGRRAGRARGGETGWREGREGGGADWSGRAGLVGLIGVAGRVFVSSGVQGNAGVGVHRCVKGAHRFPAEMGAPRFTALPSAHCIQHIAKAAHLQFEFAAAGDTVRALMAFGTMSMACCTTCAQWGVQGQRSPLARLHHSATTAAHAPPQQNKWGTFRFLNRCWVWMAHRAGVARPL